MLEFCYHTKINNHESFEMPTTQELEDLNESNLSTISPSDHKFDGHKKTSREIARLYGLTTSDGFESFLSGQKTVKFSGYSEKIQRCGHWLNFLKTPTGLKLIEAKFCKTPNCPMCQWRRSLKWRAKFLEILPEVQDQFSNHKWLFLTLTIKNCELDDLKTTIKRLNDAFNRLSKQSGFPMVGLVKSVEVTRAWDCYDAFSGELLGRHGSKWVYDYQKKHNTALRLEPTTEVHPHLHIVGLVQSSYFGGNYYIKHSEWVTRWKQALRIEYDPIVNIKAVKCKKGDLPKPEEFDKDNSVDKGMISAICETLKYTVKEQDLIGSASKDDDVNSSWLKKITQQLYKSRKVEYRGVLKEIGKELQSAHDDDDLIKINEWREEEEERANGEEIQFTWAHALERYVKREIDSM